MQSICKRTQKEKSAYITSLHSDRGGEFTNKDLVTFCKKPEIKHKFSTPRTPQQDGLVGRRN